MIQLIVIQMSSVIPLHAPFTFAKSYDSAWSLFFTIWANFDGVHYVNIARDGYVQFEQAFFPLFPLMLRLSFTRTPEYVVLFGMVISSVSLWFFFYTILLFFKETDGLNRRYFSWFLVFYLIFPTSFFLSALYTESFFLLLFSLYLLFGYRRKYLFACIVGVLLGLTRLNGLFAIVSMLYVITLHDYHLKKGQGMAKSLKERIKRGLDVTFGSLQTLFLAPEKWKMFAVLLSPLFGFGAYAAYLWYTTGDPLFFFHSQPAFGANRSTSLVLLPQVYFRYIKILLTADITFQYFISLVELFIMTGVLAAVIYDIFIAPHASKQYQVRLGIALFSGLNVFVPSLTGTFSSIPRYALICLTLFMVFAEIRNKYVKGMLMFVFCLLQILFFAFFSRGYFVS